MAGIKTKYSLLALMAALFLVSSVHSQLAPDAPIEAPEPVIEAVQENPTDRVIAQRIDGIFSEITSLADVDVTVSEGVVTLTGGAPNETQAQNALALANRVEGVVTVDDQIERTLDIEGNVQPMIDQFRASLASLVRALPLIGLASLIFLIIAFLTHRLACWMRLWRRIMPNTFLAELLSQAIRVAGIIIALITALNLIGATALMGTILGGAGVLGIAIGFAVRDTLENYISSIMLSLRQPFRSGDHIIINEHEGIAVRLTSRATILMTREGNHLRIPNATVFKAVILNYTTNPERRFDFELGVDAADNPIAAMQSGLNAISAFAFVLDEPKPAARIQTVGDSNIVLQFQGWVNQSETDFHKARSLAIRAAMTVLEDEGFTMPEPIYRLRFDGAPPIASNATEAEISVHDFAPEPPVAEKKVGVSDHSIDVSRDTSLEEKAAEERAEGDGSDLLDESKPTE